MSDPIHLGSEAQPYPVQGTTQADAPTIGQPGAREIAARWTLQSRPKDTDRLAAEIEAALTAACAQVREECARMVDTFAAMRRKLADDFDEQERPEAAADNRIEALTLNQLASVMRADTAVGDRSAVQPAGRLPEPSISAIRSSSVAETPKETP